MTVSSAAFSLLCATWNLLYPSWGQVYGILLGLLLLCTGAIIPLDRLPGPLAAIGLILPTTHGLPAVREALTGASLLDVVPALAREATVAMAYVLGGTAWFFVLERLAARDGLLESAE